MACGDVGGRVTDCTGSSVAVEWSDPEGDDGAPIPVRRLRLNLRNWVAVATANMAKRVQSGRREEMKGRTQRRMTMAFRWVRCLERPLCSAWTRRVRFPGVRALGGSSARRLGGLTGRQLTGPAAEAPGVNFRRSARSDHVTELAARSPGGADANSSFSVKRSSRKKKLLLKKNVHCPGVPATLRLRHPDASAPDKKTRVSWSLLFFQGPCWMGKFLCGGRPVGANVALLGATPLFVRIRGPCGLWPVKGNVSGASFCLVCCV